MTLDTLLVELDNVQNFVFSDQNGLFVKMKEIMPWITKYMSNFLELIPELNKVGMDIDINIVIAQLRSLTEAIGERNVVAIFDTTQYEIKDTLLYYSEILNAIKEG